MLKQALDTVLLARVAGYCSSSCTWISETVCVQSERFIAAVTTSKRVESGSGSGISVADPQ